MITALQILNFILLIIAVEAVTEIIVSSELFKPLRLMVSPMDDFCGYCMSVWVAGFFIYFESPLITTLIYIFAAHRLANLFHEGCSRWFKRKPFVGVMTLHHNNLNQETTLDK